MPKTTRLQFDVDNPVQRLSEYQGNQDKLDAFLTRRLGSNPKFVKVLPGTAFYSAAGSGKPYGGSGTGAHMSEWGRRVHMEVQIELTAAITRTAVGSHLIGQLNEGMRPPISVQWDTISGVRGSTPPWVHATGYVNTAGEIRMEFFAAPGNSASYVMPVGTKFAISIEFVRG